MPGSAADDAAGCGVAAPSSSPEQVSPPKGISLYGGLDEDEEEEDPSRNFGFVRRGLYHILKSQVTESVLGGVIMVNLVLLIVETDAGADGIDAPEWVAGANYVLLSVYTVELFCRLFVMRLSFFKDGWCIMDFLIVGSDLVLLLLDIIIGNMPKISVLRAARLVRLARAFKALSMFPELALLLRGFVCAFKAIFWGVLLVLIVLTIWSILAVQLLHEINTRVTLSGEYERMGCERCPHAFSSVWNSVCTFTQQLVAGDSWGQVSLPIISEAPMAYFFFLSVLVSVSLAIMNLILAVIVDSAEEARQETLLAKADEKEQEWSDSARRFMKTCIELDADGSGNLSREELLHGWDTGTDFATMMQSIGIKREDTELIFHVLDKDNSGDVNYQEFMDEMLGMRQADVHSILMFIKFHVADLRISLGDQMDAKLERTMAKTFKMFSSEAAAMLGTQAAAAKPQGGAWEPLGDTAFSLRMQPEGTGNFSIPSTKVDELTELKNVNQELVNVMKEMVQRTEAHTKILTNLDQSLPGLMGKWQPLGEGTAKAAPPAVADGGSGVVAGPAGRAEGRSLPPRSSLGDLLLMCNESQRQRHDIAGDPVPAQPPRALDGLGCSSACAGGGGSRAAELNRLAPTQGGGGYVAGGYDPPATL